VVLCAARAYVQASQGRPEDGLMMMGGRGLRSPPPLVQQPGPGAKAGRGPGAAGGDKRGGAGMGLGIRPSPAAPIPQRQQGGGGGRVGGQQGAAGLARPRARAMFQHPAYSVQEPLVMAEADVAVVVEVRHGTGVISSPEVRRVWQQRGKPWIA
jgi:hypothetical protein